MHLPKSKPEDFNNLTINIIIVQRLKIKGLKPFIICN